MTYIEEVNCLTGEVTLIEIEEVAVEPEAE
jgi:hypothetical protein